VHNILTLGIWQKAALAGAAAALSVLKSTVMTLLTGQTALLGIVSRQLRADRERPVAKHPVSVRPAKTRTRARKHPAKKATHPARKAAPAAPPTPDPYQGEHEAKEPGL
jgi:cell division septation protein DedD